MFWSIAKRKSLGFCRGSPSEEAEDWNRRWATASGSTPASAAALVTLFSITDEELCADYWPDLHNSGACNCHSVTNFGEVLRVGAGTKINPRRCENVGSPAIFGVTRQ